MVDVKEKVKEGYIHARVILEIAGKPKEHIEKTLKQYIEKMKESIEFKILSEDYADIKELEDGVFTKFVELEMLHKNIPALLSFCFDFMPSSIEIIAPETCSLRSHEISDFMNDLQAKLHELDMMVKQTKMENGFVKKNMGILVTNYVTLVLTKSQMTIGQISKLTGIPDTDLKPILETLIKEKKIIEKEGKYTKNDD